MFRFVQSEAYHTACSTQVLRICIGVSTTSVSDLNLAAFLTNFGLVSPSSRLILTKAASLLSSSHVLFNFPVNQQALTGLQSSSARDSVSSKPGTFLDNMNFLRPVFSVLICTIKALHCFDFWSTGSFPTAPRV